MPVDEFTGMWMTPEPSGDLERTAGRAGSATGAAKDSDAIWGDTPDDTAGAADDTADDAEAGAAIARYEAGDQGWGVPPAYAPEDDRPRA